MDSGRWASQRRGLGYGELMRFVPKAERAARHAKAMDTAERADLGAVIELWLETREIERLVRRFRKATDAEIEDLSHYRTEPAAKRLAPSHPDVAAKVYRALGFRILKAKKQAADLHYCRSDAPVSASSSRQISWERSTKGTYS